MMTYTLHADKTTDGQNIHVETQSTSHCGEASYPIESKHTTVRIRQACRPEVESSMDTRVPPKMQAGDIENKPTITPSSMDQIMAYLHKQTTVAITSQPQHNLAEGSKLDGDLPSNESPVQPVTPDNASEQYITTPTSDTRPSSLEDDTNEVLRLRMELEATRSRMARIAHEKSQMEQELHQRRINVDTLEHTVDPDTESDVQAQDELLDIKLQQMNAAQPQLRGGAAAAVESWSLPMDGPSRGFLSNSLPDGPGRNMNSWAASCRPSFPVNTSGAAEQPMPPPAVANGWNLNSARTGPWFGGSGHQGPNSGALPAPQPVQRPFAGLRIDTNMKQNGQQLNDPANLSVDPNFRRNVATPGSRPSSAALDSRFGSWPSYPPSIASAEGATSTPPLTPLSSASFGLYPPSAQGPYQPRPIGTRTGLSPMAAEFNIDAPRAWNGAMMAADPSSTYVAPVEPMNYRRLLDRNMTCNWKYIVDKIVSSNDQQASIFLQQKLKVGTSEQKYEIVDAIVQQAIPLMMNRFGNFLVQRCFEHGTQEQVIQIAQAIRGNTLMLSMDAFGCHVIQKAFDCVPEEYKAIMVHELLRRIPETVIHRYACHVWQKLFELRWSDSPPQIMKYVNEALRGMWHEVALGETGSLVVQNIFENCLEEDKRPCINEVLASIDVIAHGQFGNWCIQHICEHGASGDRTRAIDHILRFATEYSVDQYASKVIEKCLKIGGTEFLDRYLERVCEGRADRPRMPLIDIAGDQFGNYLIQYILLNASPQHREIVASHVRKHMVSLRGSKYGSRVAMLCCNPAIATRPGPPAGIPSNRYPSSNNGHGNRGYFGGAYR